MNDVLMYNCKAFCILLFSILIGCKKYPEGGHHGSTIKKITGPYWVENLTVDGIDSTSHMVSQLNHCSEIEFSFEDNYAWGNEEAITGNCDTFPSNSWGANEDKTTLIVTCHHETGMTQFFPLVLNEERIVNWEIECLTKDKFWIKATLNGKEYYLKLHYFH